MAVVVAAAMVVLAVVAVAVEVVMVARGGLEETRAECGALVAMEAAEAAAMVVVAAAAAMVAAVVGAAAAVAAATVAEAAKAKAMKQKMVGGKSTTEVAELAAASRERGLLRVTDWRPFATLACLSLPDR